MPEDKEKGLARLVDECVTQNFFVTGCRWGKGLNPQVTIDLGEEREIQGVSVHQNIDTAWAKGNTASAYADFIEVSVSSDNVKWEKAGTITKYDLFNWPGDYLPLGLEAMQFSSAFFGGIINYNCPMAFDKPLHAKYVRFTVSNPNDSWSPTEIRVFGEMKRIKWNHDNFEYDKMGK